MLTKDEFERRLRAELRSYDGPRTIDAGYDWWVKLAKERTDLECCRCQACRTNPWNCVRGILRRSGFRDDPGPHTPTCRRDRPLRPCR